MRDARGFATGNGRCMAGGVCGAGAAGFEKGGGWTIVGMGLGKDVSGVDGDELSVSFEPFSGVEVSSGPSKVSGGGSDVLGDGGGSTKDVGRIVFAEVSGSFKCRSRVGITMGITSVSYAGSTFVGGGIEKMEERRDARVLRPLLDLPTTFGLRGELRDFFS
jgi:hypothetical protein